MKSTENLIQELSNDKTQKRSAFSPLLYTFVVFICVGFLQLLFMNLRNPLMINQLNRFLIWELFFLLSAIGATIYLGFQALAPGTNRKWAFLMGLISLILFILINSIHTKQMSSPYAIRSFCEVEAFVLSSFTILPLHFIVKRFPLFDFQLLPKVIFLITPMIVSIILHSVCSIELVHVLECHILPAVIPGILYLGIRKKVYS